MPTTSNFGWTTPADTDLVKDGALAIRTLGNGIDTSFLDLKGGTTGQILSKASNTDLDYTWINNDQGDITAVTAGTGITVTGGTGPTPAVALTIPVVESSGGTNQTTYTTGDILYASASNTLSKRAIGTSGQVLTVSGGVPTWATASGGSSGPAFKATKSSGQSITSGAYVKIAYQTEVFDTDNCYDPTTNYRFTPNKAGYYQVNAGMCFIANSASTVLLKLYKNGSSDTGVWENDGFTNEDIMTSGSTLIYLNGSSDYIELYGYHGGTSPQVVGDGGRFEAIWIRS